MDKVQRRNKEEIERNPGTVLMRNVKHFSLPVLKTS